MEAVAHIAVPVPALLPAIRVSILVVSVVPVLLIVLKESVVYRFAWHSVIPREPAAQVRHLAPLAAEGSPRRVDSLPPAIHAERFGLRQTRSLYQSAVN